MAIHVTHDLKHDDILDTLTKLDLQPQRAGDGYKCDLGYVGICRSNHLLVQGQLELATLMLEHCRPWGEELEIHFHT